MNYNYGWDYHQKQIEKYKKRRHITSTILYLMFVSFLVVSMAACGPEINVNVYRSLELKDYVLTLSQETGHNLETLSILLAKIDDPDYKQAGGLHLPGNNMILIDVQSFEWAIAGDMAFSIDAILAHEYGHYLGLEHNNNVRNDDCPESIMNEYISNISETCWNTHKSTYYQELKE